MFRKLFSGWWKGSHQSCMFGPAVYENGKKGWFAITTLGVSELTCLTPLLHRSSPSLPLSPLPSPIPLYSLLVILSYHPGSL